MHGPQVFRSNPAITVAMVTYNSARFLRDAIDSVLAQEFEDFELLICDDGSHDGTPEIAAGYDDPRIRLVRNETNMGEYLNRNKALGLARGRYLVFLDGDDYLYPDGLGYMVDMMSRFPSAGFGAALPPSEKFIYPLEMAPREFCSCAYFGPMVIANDFTQLVFHTETLRNFGGFDKRYRTGDTYIQYALGMRFKCVLMSAGHAWWRHRAGQASESLTQSGQSLSESWRYCRELLATLDCPLDAQGRSLARANLSRMVLRNAAKRLLRGQFHDAIGMLLDAPVPPTEWHYLFSRHQAPYLNEVTGENPLRAVARAVLPRGGMPAAGAAD
jgi:glycosyltransferase involved in cell wall biosynthesis